MSAVNLAIGPNTHPQAHLGSLDSVQLAVAAQLHLGLEAAHKGAVGHALLGKVLKLVQDDLPMYHHKTLHHFRLKGKGQGLPLLPKPADDTRWPCKCSAREGSSIKPQNPAHTDVLGDT